MGPNYLVIRTGANVPTRPQLSDMLLIYFFLGFVYPACKQNLVYIYLKHWKRDIPKDKTFPVFVIVSHFLRDLGFFSYTVKDSLLFTIVIGMEVDGYGWYVDVGVGRKS